MSDDYSDADFDMSDEEVWEAAIRRHQARMEGRDTIEPDSPTATQDPTKISTHQALFGDHLNRWGVVNKPGSHDSDGPNNIREIRVKLARQRNIVFPTSIDRDNYNHLANKAFEAFQLSAREVDSEVAVMKAIWPLLVGRQAKSCSRTNILFNNLAPLTDGSIVYAKPDFWDGCNQLDLHEDARQALREYVVPSIMGRILCLPNFFMEAKGPNGNANICRRQATYDGALGARAVLAMRQYIDEETAIDGNAYTITSTLTCGGGECILTFWACHAWEGHVGDPSRQLKIQVTKLQQYDLCANQRTYLKGVNALRNARDFACEVRSRLIENVNTAARYKRIIRQQQQQHSWQPPEVPSWNINLEIRPNTGGSPSPDMRPTYMVNSNVSTPSAMPSTIIN